MIPKDCKRLAEVDFPIAVVSKHAAREKYIRHGHPSTLHLWWARRPLAACRAMLLALLLPDPCDPLCPEDFKKQARSLLSESMTTWKQPGKTDEDLRKSLLSFIGEFSNWDVAADPVFLRVGRGLVKAAHPDDTPLVVDPFAGGGSIPLEALRLGCEAFASDLSPVACLILKVMLEEIPRCGPALAVDLRRVGAEIKRQAEKEISDLYPKEPDGATPIAYLWARTVRCEAPNCGAEIPLVRSFWLRKKAGRKRALRYRVVRRAGEPPHVEFEIFVPTAATDVPAGFAAAGKAWCPACQSVLGGQRVQAQLAAERGGATPRFDASGRRVGGAMLIAIVATSADSSGRMYRVPNERDYQPLLLAERRPLAGSPTEEINPVRPSPNARGLSAVTRYGMRTFGDIYSRRQLVALSVFAQCVSHHVSRGVGEALALAVGRAANAWTSVSRWHQTGEKVEGAFNGQKIPMVWDFAEAIPVSGATGGWDGAVEWVAGVAENLSWIATPGQVRQADAAQAVLPEASAAAWFTDPPYYDAVPYADLADFFLVWLRRARPELKLGDPYTPSNPLSPKVQECVWNQSQRDEAGSPKTSSFFERKFAEVAATGRRTLADRGVACIVFAHKSTEGWEALLAGLTSGGFVIRASWPIATEMAQRTNARGTASLMGSVHLVCRPRPDDAPVGDWAEVLRELPRRVGDWMERLQKEGIRGADLVFACIGPALEIYSRYSKVVDAEEREIPLGGDPEASEPHKRGFLAYVWEVVGRTALEHVLGTAEAKARNSAAGALEEDARLTALFLWTLQSTNGEANHRGDAEHAEEEADKNEEDSAPSAPQRFKGFSLVFDVVRRFAQPLGIHLPEWEGRIIETKKGVVRLLPVEERAKQLFGEEGAQAVAEQLEQNTAAHVQQMLFPELEIDLPQRRRGHGGKSKVTLREETLRAPRLSGEKNVTTLDRVHAAMLLQAGGRTNALRALLEAEQQRGPDFLRLANALSALYPRESEEKRLLDAMLLAVPR